MAGKVVLSTFEAKKGHEEELVELLIKHIPLLRDEGLISSNPAMLIRSRETKWFIEIFEWRSEDMEEEARQVESIKEIWDEIENHANVRSIGGLKEADAPFPEFDLIRVFI